jgi:hypothetical protein
LAHCFNMVMKSRLPKNAGEFLDLLITHLVIKKDLLYVFFWVIPQRLNFICRRFGTLFHLHRQIGVEFYTYLPIKMEQTDCSETSAYKTQTPGEFLHLPAYENWTQSVPKRRHIKFRHRGITQKKTYNIQNKAKVWNQDRLVFLDFVCLLTVVVRRGQFSIDGL